MAVYIVQPGDEPVVKIGSAEDVASRVATLQGGLWLDLKLLREIPGDHAFVALASTCPELRSAVARWLGLAPTYDKATAEALERLRAFVESQPMSGEIANE